MNKFLRSIRETAARNGIKLAVIGGSLVPVLSHAAIDTTEALAGVTDAQTAVLAVLGGMIAMAVAVWGVRKVLRFFGR